MTKEAPKIIRKLKGVVVSDKMEKAVVVEVERIRSHPKYLKRYKTHARYKASDPKGIAKAGDKVIIAATRPLSKNIRWEVVSDKKE